MRIILALRLHGIGVAYTRDLVYGCGSGCRQPSLYFLSHPPTIYACVPRERFCGDLLFANMAAFFLRGRFMSPSSPKKAT
jgi:hypothetical protein